MTGDSNTQFVPKGTVNITENGLADVKAYASANVNVQPTLIQKSITVNGTYNASSDNADGFSSVNVDVPDSLVAFCENKTNYMYAFAYMDGSKPISVPEFTQNPSAKNCQNMCMSSTALVSFNPQFDFSQITNVNDAFYSCQNLEKIPSIIDLASCVYASEVFRSCNKLKEIHIRNSSRVTTFADFARQSYALEKVDIIDGTACTNFNRFFYFGHYPNLTYLRFVPNTIKVSFDFRCCPALDSDSVQSIVDGLATITSAQTVTFNNAITLTAEQQQTIEEKGWTLAFAERV